MSKPRHARIGIPPGAMSFIHSVNSFYILLLCHLKKTQIIFSVLLVLCRIVLFYVHNIRIGKNQTKLNQFQYTILSYNLSSLLSGCPLQGIHKCYLIKGNPLFFYHQPFTSISSRITIIYNPIDNRCQEV